MTRTAHRPFGASTTLYSSTRTYNIRQGGHLKGSTDSGAKKQACGVEGVYCYDALSIKEHILTLHHCQC